MRIAECCATATTYAHKMGNTSVLDFILIAFVCSVSSRATVNARTITSAVKVVGVSSRATVSVQTTTSAVKVVGASNTAKSAASFRNAAAQAANRVYTAAPLHVVKRTMVITSADAVVHGVKRTLRWPVNVEVDFVKEVVAFINEIGKTCIVKGGLRTTHLRNYKDITGLLSLDLSWVDRIHSNRIITVLANINFFAYQSGGGSQIL